MHSLPQHFSNCASAQLSLCEEDSYYRLPYLLTGLARLPKLDTLDVTVEGETLPIALTALALYCMRTQLLQLRCLDLKVHRSWRGATHVWHELGNMTQLTGLLLHCSNEEVADPWDEADVLPLRNLHSLQRLDITDSTDFFWPLLSAELAAGLTSLTEVQLGGCPVAALKHVSSCVALRSLFATCPEGAEQELGQAEWAAVGCLTGLTRLELLNARFLSASPECCAAVNSLLRLQVTGAYLWSADILSAFSSCVHLTKILGHWEQGSIADFVVLPSVLALGETGGSPPLAAFPNLTAIEQDEYMFVKAFGSIAQHCTGLTELAVYDGPRSSTSLPPDATSSARIGAIKSLSALTHLTRLDFRVRDNTELAVLVNVAAGLLSVGLKRLDLLLLSESPRLSVGALMLVAKLRGVPLLGLKPLANSIMVGVRKDPDTFLMSLSGNLMVSVMLPEQEDLDAVEAACQRLKESGLPCPDLVLSITNILQPE